MISRFKRNRLGRIVGIRCTTCGMTKRLASYRCLNDWKPSSGAGRRSVRCKTCEDKKDTAESRCTPWTLRVV